MWANQTTIQEEPLASDTTLAASIREELATFYYGTQEVVVFRTEGLRRWPLQVYISCLPVTKPQEA